MIGKLLKISGFLVVTLIALFASVSLVASTRMYGNPPNGMEPFYNASISTTKISDNLFVLRGGIANVIVLITDDGVLLVDTDVIEMVEKVESAIARITDKKIKYVINTHAHHDHREGNGYFRAKGADIIAHANAKQAIESAVGSPKVSSLDVPTITYEEEYVFQFGGEEIRLRHVALGHTDGDTLVYFSNHNVLATGDIFVHRGLPFISLGSGASIDSALRGQTQILELVDQYTIIAPGHGPLTDRAGFVDTHNKLKKIRERVAALKEKGVSARLSRAYFPTRNTWRPWREELTGMNDRYFIFLVHSSLPEESIESAD